jgi:septal ring factor EnvC (AmiA/AmiB activator)
MRISLNRLNQIKTSRRLQLIVAAGVIVVSTSTALAFNNLASTQAGDTPVEVTVEDHDKRLTKNESDIGETKDRVTDVEQKTDENTQAVREVEKQVVVVDGKANAATSAAKQAQQAAQAAPAPQPAPTPVPVKTINPRLITAVSAVQQFDRFDNPTVWSCDYTLESGRVINSLQGPVCGAVGTEIGSDLASMHGVR